MFHNIVFLRYSILLFVFAFFAPGYAEGQSLGVFQSTMDNQQYELKQTGALDLGIYAADGTIVGVLSRKKATEKFKGETRRLAAKCPDNAGKLEVTDWGTARIRMRVETPSVNMTNKMACMVAFLPEWESFDFIRRSAESPVSGFSIGSKAGDGAEAATPTPQQDRGSRQARLPVSVAGAAPRTQTGTNQNENLSEGTPGNTLSSSSRPALSQANDFQALLFQTFVNGGGNFEATAVTMDKEGNLYLGGSCEGVPMVKKLDKSGAFFHFQSAVAPPNISKLFCTDLPRGYGDGINSPGATIRSIQLDSAGRIWIAGNLNEPNHFHTVNAFRPKPTPAGQTIPNYSNEAFVARLSSNGKTIEFATLLGGMGRDYIYASVVTMNDELWVTGTTSSADFPRILSLMDHKGGDDMFLVRFDTAGKPRFSSTIGGIKDETGTSIAMAPDGHVLVAGYTSSGDGSSAALEAKSFPFSVSAPCGSPCGFLIDFDPNQNKLAWIKHASPSEPPARQLFISSDGNAVYFQPTSVATTPDGRVHIAGIWPNSEIPNAYLRFDRNLERQELVVSLGRTFYPLALAVGLGGDVFLSGSTTKTYELDITRDFNNTDHGPQAVAARIDPQGRLLWTYSFSGRNPYRRPTDFYWYPQDQRYPFDLVSMIATNQDEVAFVGTSMTPNMPTSPRSVQPQPSQGREVGSGNTYLKGGAFAAKFSVKKSPPTCAEWTVPGKLYLTNQGGQDFQAFVVSNLSSCEWSVKSADPWIKAQPIEGARGTSLIKIDVETNVDDKRAGKVIVTGKSGETFTMEVIQSAVPMGVMLPSSTVDVSSKRGGVSQISVEANAETEWAVSSTAEWIKVETPIGKGKGSIRIRTMANAGSTPRAGFVIVGDRQVTITQGVEDLPEEGQAATAKTPVPPAAGTPKPAVSRPVPPPNRRIPVPAQKK
jgi:hypothetical protein